MSVLTVPSFTEVIQRLIKLIRKPKQYVDLTAIRDSESGSAKGLLEHDIIIIGGGMLPFFLNVIKSQNVSDLVRNGWLCACFSSFRGPGYSRAPT
jgi:peptidase E